MPSKSNTDKNEDPPVTDAPQDAPQDGITADEFAEQPQIVLPGGPYVKFVATDQYTHKIITAADIKLAGYDMPEGVAVLEWNPNNGYLVPTSVFGKGGKDNDIVKRLLADPAREFAYVPASEA